jgi:hypothetical protein
MKSIATFLVIQTVLALVWLLVRVPFGDVLVIAASAVASLALLASSLFSRQPRIAMAIVLMGAIVLSGYRHAVRQSNELAIREFSHLVDSGEACGLVAMTFPNKQWSTRVKGFYSRPVVYFGATSDILFVNAYSPPELRLAPLAGEMRLVRLDASSCSPHGTTPGLPR